MHGTQETGVDFIHRVSAEIRLVQEEIRTLKGAIEETRSAMKSESKIRESEVVKLNDNIAHERSLEAQMRTMLENRLEDFEGKTKSWVGVLGKELGAVKNQATALETFLGERAAEHKAQVAHDDKRIWAIEQELPKKSTLAQLQALEAEISHQRTSTHRDLAAANAAIQAGEASATRDFKMAEEHIGRLQTVVDDSKKTLLADLAVLARKLDSVEAFTHTRAKATDVQALEPRIFDSEKSIDQLGQALSTKACSAEMQAISGRLSSLTIDIQANQSRSQADKEVVLGQIASVESGLEKTNRQLDVDRDRNAQHVMGLERELGTKAARAEIEILGPSILTTATDKIDKRAMVLEQQIFASRHESALELLPFKTRLEGLEAAFPTRADIADVQRLTLALSDSNSRHEAAYRRAQEHGIRIENMEGSVTNTALKHEALESRSNSLHQAISTKAEITEHFTKEHTSELLKDFYRKEEVDALLSRVWWRVGDMTQGKPNASFLK